MARLRVRKVIDGDTFEDTQHRFFRLAGVDTPERGERGFQKAKETLNNLVGGEELIVQIEGKSYGRSVATVRKPGEKTTINEKMRRRGYTAE